MLDKIKKAVTYIALPLTLLFALFSYLMSQISTLKADAKRKDSEKALADTIVKLDLKEKEANDAEADYRRARDEYLKSNPSD